MRSETEAMRLISPGVLGFYSHLEITEVVAFPDGARAANNIFTIAVAEHGLSATSKIPRFLNPSRMKIPNLRGWSFGVYQYARPISALQGLLQDLEKGTWRASGNDLNIGALTPLPPQFVPPDSAKSVAWNNVLKNNFGNGSHIFEWADASKGVLRPFFDLPRRLVELSDAIRPFVPLGIASLSDRIGNIVLQVPVTVLIAKVGGVRGSSDFTIKIAWDSQATPRALRATCELEYDGAITGYVSTEIAGAETRLTVQPGRGLHRAVIWDDFNRTILAATGQSGFIQSIPISIRVSSSEPRVFTMRDQDGTEVQHRVVLVGQPSTTVVGEAPDLNGTWTQNRMYREETARLVSDRTFVQYHSQPGQRPAGHERALNDIRLLIDRHGEAGVWLWDPFLNAKDIIETLFYCKYCNADLRALTMAKEVPTTVTKQGLIQQVLGWLQKLGLRINQRPEATFIEQQCADFEAAKSNLRGLRLEFRVKSGQAGWGFHDRFLIFPKGGRGALAWSLGTSINSIGLQHHILQRVDDGQRVADAFEELWQQLGAKDHLVWKTP